MKLFAIQCTLSEKRTYIYVISIIRFNDDDDDHGCSTGTITST